MFKRLFISTTPPLSQSIGTPRRSRNYVLNPTETVTHWNPFQDIKQV